MNFKILTLNIHKGLDWKNGKPTVKDLKNLLIQVNPDIIFLQEVVGHHKKHSQKFDDWVENQFEYLFHELWPNTVYSHHALFKDRHHGNVILSKYKILKNKVIDISTNPREQRAVLYTELETEATNIHCFCVHLNLLHKDRLKQYKKIEELILSKKIDNEPIILAGDFNDWRLKASNELQMKEAYKDFHGDYAKTFPAPFPLLKLDRIYISSLNVNQAEVPGSKGWKKISDHLPILIEVEYGD